MRLQVICWILAINWSVALAQVDPDLFDGRTAANAVTKTHAAAEDPVTAASGPDLVNAAQPKEIKVMQKKSVDATQIMETAAQATVANPAPKIPEKTNQGSEASLPATAEVADQSNIEVGKFARFSVGGGSLSPLPEKSSKQLNLKLQSLPTAAGVQSPQTATKGALRSTEIKSVNRDRGTDLPTNL